MSNTPLVPCEDCGRHVRFAERECPFCGAGLSKQAHPEVAVIPKLSRAGILAATALLSLEGCENGLIPVAHAQTVEPTAYAPQYGAPPEYRIRQPDQVLLPMPPIPQVDAGADSGPAIQPSVRR